MNYLRAQVNFRQLRAETAGNRYLRRFLPATAGIFTCGSGYLRPSQVILHAPVLQCISNTVSIIYNGLSYFYVQKDSTLIFYYDQNKKLEYNFSCTTLASGWSALRTSGIPLYAYYSACKHPRPVWDCAHIRTGHWDILKLNSFLRKVTLPPYGCNLGQKGQFVVFWVFNIRFWTKIFSSVRKTELTIIIARTR